MATNTYVALKSTTLTSSSASILLDNIPQGYTDLELVVSSANVTANSTIFIVLNGDTGSNYSFTYLNGDGATPTTGRASSLAFGVLGDHSTGTSINIGKFINYSNTTTYKTWMYRGGRADYVAGSGVNLWRSTAAINSITLSATSGRSFAIGSTFTVYGIANADNFVKATGGIISEDSTYTYHVFGSSGTFTPKQSLTADILMVGGGGGGATAAGGGGGAGGLVISSGTSLSATAYTVTVGSGGNGAAGDGTSGSVGTSTTFNGWTANGGGGGGHGGPGAIAPSTGGSGGGGGYRNGSTDCPGAAATQTSPSGATGYGNSGGSTTFGAGPPYRGSGGGGAGAAGTSINSAILGTGGVGRTDSFINAIGLATSTGEYSSGNWYFAGGGGGSLNDTVVPGGLGGGGAGGTATTTAPNAKAQKGLANTGGGGGGGEVTGAYVGSGSAGGAGGSGIVIIRYPK